MWRYIVPELSKHYTVVLFDYVGSGQSDWSAFDADRYSTLEGYAEDVIEIVAALELQDVIFIGHSVSGTIGLLATQAAPSLFTGMVMVCPSPCFLNIPPDYVGGFERSDLEDLLSLMEKNYLGWVSFLAPLVMGGSASESLVDELSSSFCSIDPEAARIFAHATFFSDYRHRLAHNQHPALILQSSVDTLAGPEVGRFMKDSMPASQLSIIEADGHCLHMTHPELVLRAIHDFLSAATTNV